MEKMLSCKCIFEEFFAKPHLIIFCSIKYYIEGVGRRGAHSGLLSLVFIVAAAELPSQMRCDMCLCESLFSSL